LTILTLVGDQCRSLSSSIYSFLQSCRWAR
jgi:hypothetical protein